MRSDRPCMPMRKKSMELPAIHGETEVHRGNPTRPA
jgi:hypothetical protein